MLKAKWIALLTVVLAVGLTIGCAEDDDEAGGGNVAGSYAGTWTGNVCGRGVTLVLSQDGTNLSGSYTFTDPTFNDTCAGTVSSTTPPATAILRSTGGHDFWFDIRFDDFGSFSGGYYKSGVKACDVSARK